MLSFEEKPLSKKEEQELIKKYKNQPKVLREKLVAHNHKMALQMAHQYENVANFEDLVQEGSKGLVIAAERFDYNRGIKFNSFAVHYVKKYILAFIGDEKREKFLSEKHDQPVISYDGPITTDDINSMENNIHDTDIFDKDATYMISDALNTLDDIEKKVIHYRFVERQTLDELGKKFKFSLSNIKAIETKALNKMKKHLNSCNLYKLNDVLNFE